MTHGELWLQRALKRVEGYCRTRSYRLRGVWRVRTQFPFSRVDQWILEIEDLHFHWVEIATTLFDNSFTAVDDYGNTLDTLTASLFDELTPALTPRIKPSPRQLVLL